MPRICATSPIRIFLLVFLLGLLILLFYSDSATWHSSLKSIQDPVIRLLDYNEYVKSEQLTSSDFVVETADLLAHVHSQCQRYGYSSDFSSRRNFMPNAVTIAIPEYNMLYVSNPKTGSTSFKKFIMRLQGDTTPYDEMLHVHQGPKKKFTFLEDVVDGNVMYRNLTVQEVISAKLYVVGFVRNPITRLISGFRNKVLRTEGGGYNRKIYEIVPNTATDVERFKVFVELVTSGQVTDHHFTPQWKKMRVCSFPYNLLGQTETTRDNIETLMREVGIRGVQFPGSRTDRGNPTGGVYPHSVFTLGFYTR